MDWLGAISGIIAGQAFSPLSKKAQYDYLYQGASKGVSEPWRVGYLGVSSAIGTASLGYPKGIQTALTNNAGLVGVIQQSSKPYAQAGQNLVEGTETAFDVLSIFTKYWWVFALGIGGLFLYNMIKK